MNLDPALQTFVTESRELLEAMEEALLRLEEEPANSDLLNAIFRAAHTIKGSAGVFGFDDIVAFTHEVESLLDKVRDGTVFATADLAALLLRSGDHMALLVDAASTGHALDATAVAAGAALIGEIKPYLSGGQAAASAPSAAPVVTAVPAAGANEPLAENALWHISLRFGPEVLRNGMDPLSFLRYLMQVGEIVHLTTLTERLPEAAEMDPEACYLGFELGVRSDADKTTIEGVFEFVREDCRISILPPQSKVSEYVRLIEELPEDTLKLGEMLVASGALTRAELDAGLVRQADQASTAVFTGAPENPAQPLGQILIEDGAVAPAVVDAALGKQERAKEQKAKEAQFLRVDAEKLDHLINLVGELVIAGAGAQLLAQAAGNGALLEAGAAVSALVEEVRNTALGLRMVQIGATFQRFQRVVRDVSRELGKDIELVINGGETELDKSVVEKIGDPLMHLVRNAMDHGIEPIDVRTAAGKPARAQLQLNAYHDSGSIVIEVSDDGGGLKRDKILKKALERGLVAGGDELSDKDIFKLIFEPGFSTAEQVSNLSGRGVGMDVVRRNIEALRGTVEIDSVADRGTTVRIRLPLTLAIIDGFLVRVGAAHYIIPLDMVVECIELTREDRQQACDRGYINLRGEVLPLTWLHEVFGLERSTVRRENIVVAQFAGRRIGLIIDDLLGESQTVIKPLGRLFGHLKGIGGSTILGSGEVALIIDVAGLVQRVADSERARFERRVA